MPKSLRTDKSLNDIFESLYPGQIEHAEMLIDTSKLEDIIEKRRSVIEKYDDVDARYRYERWLYEEYKRTGKVSDCCYRKISEPSKPQVRISMCSGEKEDAYSYYNNKIVDLDDQADKEYDKIFENKEKWRNENILENLESDDSFNMAQIAAHNVYTLFVPSKVRRFFGEESAFFYGIGMVTFKSIAVKQSGK